MPITENASFTLSGFADEIADDFEAQLDAFDELGIQYIDIRNVDGTSVVDLTDDELDRVQDQLDAHGIEVASIGSPIGKIYITEDFEPHLERFERTLAVADRLDTDKIRLFSYWIPDDDEAASYREEVMRRMQAKVDLAEEAGITLLHENEKDLYGDTPERCRDLLTTLDSPNFQAIFDPANFLEIGVHPYPDALLQLVEYVSYMHIKDAKFGERGAIRPAGEGDGEIPKILGALQRRGFSGFTALEPHLAQADEMGGYSGPEAFRKATDALTDILDDIDATYE